MEFSNISSVISILSYLVIAAWGQPRFSDSEESRQSSVQSTGTLVHWESQATRTTHGYDSSDNNRRDELLREELDDANTSLRRMARFDRFYYCGPKKGGNSCRSLCYAMGYPTHICGRVSCYCTF